MRWLLAILAALAIGWFTGAWYGSQPRTCAWVDSNYGQVLLCSNDYQKEMGQ